MSDRTAPWTMAAGDELLRLIFHRCHPTLVQREARTALALRLILRLRRGDRQGPFAAGRRTSLLAALVRAEAEAFGIGAGYEDPTR